MWIVPIIDGAAADDHPCLQFRCAAMYWASHIRTRAGGKRRWRTQRPVSIRLLLLFSNAFNNHSALRIECQNRSLDWHTGRALQQREQISISLRICRNSPASPDRRPGKRLSPFHSSKKGKKNWAFSQVAFLIWNTIYSLPSWIKSFLYVSFKLLLAEPPRI